LASCQHPFVGRGHYFLLTWLYMCLVVGFALRLILLFVCLIIFHRHITEYSVFDKQKQESHPQIQIQKTINISTYQHINISNKKKNQTKNLSIQQIKKNKTKQNKSKNKSSNHQIKKIKYNKKKNKSKLNTKKM